MDLAGRSLITRWRPAGAGGGGQSFGYGQQLAVLPEPSGDLYADRKSAVGVRQGKDDDGMTGETGQQGVPHRGDGSGDLLPVDVQRS